VDAERLAEKIPLLEERARKLGLYLDQALVVETERGTVIMASLVLGDVAFTPRVQDPDADDVDRQLEALTVGMENDEFLDARTRMERNIAAGRDPLDDGEEA
jgi:hypothetical protein